MSSRFVAIWFPDLVSEGMIRRRPQLKDKLFVVAAPEHGRMRITAVCAGVRRQGVYAGMTVADARTLVADIQVLDDAPALPGQLLTGLGYWCIRYTPTVATDLPDGLVLDATGCTHLWGGEAAYVEAIQSCLQALGYTTRIAMAGTVGAARALARYGQRQITVTPPGEEKPAILPLPPAALRLETAVTERLQKLGLCTIGHFINMERSVLRRRFGLGLLNRIDQALGWKEEPLLPLQPVEPFLERLPCPEPVVTRTGIEIALQQLLHTLCERLVKEGRGLCKAVFKACRVDEEVQQIAIGTHLPSCQPTHLFKLFELKIDQVAPGPGIELFLLEAPKVEKTRIAQGVLWNHGGFNDNRLAELLDRLTGKLGSGIVHRYLPDEHYWPERSFKEAASLTEQPVTGWRDDRPRPLRLLHIPEPVEVAAPVPDYPPIHFRHKGQLHTIKKADGPERIEAEWWIAEGEHRDYYVVEDETGARYWLFRLGHYTGDKPCQWYLHGYFA